MHVCRLLHQKQVSRTNTSNYTPQYLWDIINCPCPWHLLLTHKSSFQNMYCNYIGIVSVFSALKDTGESITFELQMTPMESSFTHETLVRSEEECALTCRKHRDCARFSHPAEDDTCYFDAVDDVESYITEIMYLTQVVYVDVWIV